MEAIQNGWTTIPPEVLPLAVLRFGGGEGLTQKFNPVKGCFTSLSAVYAFMCIAATDGTFLDRVDLVAHEAGHLLFGYLGEFMMVIGGTLGQLLVPVGIAAYFFTRREFYSAAVVVFWIGQNLFNISVYVKDAAAMNLPLVSAGGGDSIHDWNWLLLKFNVLAWDQAIGNIVYGVGVMIVIASVVLCFRLSFEPGEGAERG